MYFQIEYQNNTLLEFIDGRGTFDDQQMELQGRVRI